MPFPLLRFSHFGPPGEVLELHEEEERGLGPDEVRIAMRLSPINPSDLNYIEGTYGIKPTLPAVAGLEGVGEIIETGAAVTAVSLGQLVRPDRRQGLWRHRVINPVDSIQVFPSELTVEQAAVASVNPPTALCLLREFVALQPGDWVVQNAANSGVGRAVIRIARALGLRTINLVRRPELIADLAREGADIVLLDTREQVDRFRQELAGTPIRLGLNAVGGDSALAVAKFLSPGGVHVTYGAMARQPVKVPNGMLIFNDISFRGFWVTQWLAAAAPERVQEVWATLAGFWQEGILSAGIEKIYPLEEYKTALQHAQQNGRSGKVAFGLGSTPI